MPELPEVETVKRVLEKWVNGRVIKDVKFVYPNTVEDYSEEEFRKLVVNQRINKINREGKFLLFVLDDYIMSSHLRMEGKYYYGKSKDGTLSDFVYDGNEDINKVKKHSCVLFLLDDNSVLIYHDVRKFGKIHVYNKSEYVPFVTLSLGKEPFDMEGKDLYKIIHTKNNPIKELIMNQKIISGIGNIYADEVCYVSSIHPERKGKDITKKECDLIIDASRKILLQAIDDGGSTIKTYHSANGVDGLFQQRLLVYGRKGELCSKCNSPIVKIRLKGRGTCFCPKCQK